MKNLVNAQKKFDDVNDKFSAVKKADFNASLHSEAKKAQQECKRFLNRKTELSDDDMKNFSKALTQFRYRVTALVLGESALQWMHENGCTLTDMHRNTYGKCLAFIDMVNGKSHHTYEQGAYAVSTYLQFISGDEITSDLTITAGQLAQTIGKSKDKPLLQTQPYAVLQALELIGAGKRNMQGRGTGWKQSSITLDPNSAFIKAFNARVNA